jgi:hypothetical protein
MKILEIAEKVHRRYSHLNENLQPKILSANTHPTPTNEIQISIDFEKKVIEFSLNSPWIETDMRTVYSAVVDEMDNLVNMSEPMMVRALTPSIFELDENWEIISSNGFYPIGSYKADKSSIAYQSVAIVGDLDERIAVHWKIESENFLETGVCPWAGATHSESENIVACSDVLEEEIEPTRPTFMVVPVPSNDEFTASFWTETDVKFPYIARRAKWGELYVPMHWSEGEEISKLHINEEFSET